MPKHSDDQANGENQQRFFDKITFALPTPRTPSSNLQLSTVIWLALGTALGVVLVQYNAPSDYIFFGAILLAVFLQGVRHVK